MKNILFGLLYLISTISYSQVVEIKHNFYTIEYDTSLREPLYSFYNLSKERLDSVNKFKNLNKRSTFKKDKIYSWLLLKESNGDEYKGTKYDKGHLSPDVDFRFNKIAQDESMLYTNCAPQYFSFNRGLWKKIEICTDSIAYSTPCTIYTGCIYKTKQKLGVSTIPDYYFKIISYKGGKRAFLCKNQIQDDHNIYHYQVNISDIKKLLNKNYKLINNL